MKAFVNLRTPCRALTLSLMVFVASVAVSPPALGKAIDNEAVENEMAAKFRPDPAKEARDKRKTDRPDDAESPKKPAPR